MVYSRVIKSLKYANQDSIMTTPREQAFQELTATGMHYELAQGSVYGRPCPVFKNITTLRDLFESTRSDREFLVYADERYTFEDTWQRASQIGSLLIERFDIKKGDRVAVSMRNFPEYLLTFIATQVLSSSPPPLRTCARPARA